MVTYRSDSGVTVGSLTSMAAGPMIGFLSDRLRNS